MHAQLPMLGICIENQPFLLSNAADINDQSMHGRNRTSQCACKLVQGIIHDIHARNASKKSQNKQDNLSYNL